MTYAEAIRALNEAAYEAVLACRDTTIYPMVDRQALRKLCTETDRLFDEAVSEGYAGSKAEGR